MIDLSLGRVGRFQLKKDCRLKKAQLLAVGPCVPWPGLDGLVLSKELLLLVDVDTPLKELRALHDTQIERSEG